jgi:hypothetical protein
MDSRPVTTAGAAPAGRDVVHRVVPEASASTDLGTRIDAEPLSALAARMDNAGDLRERARHWRRAAQDTRDECTLLVRVSGLSWRAPSAEAFRRLVSRRVRELRDLAEREEAVAELLDRIAEAAERAA